MTRPAPCTSSWLRGRGAMAPILLLAVVGCTSVSVTPVPSASPQPGSPFLPSASAGTPSPSPSSGATSPTPLPADSPARTAQTYVVQAGDSLSTIGDRFGLSIDQLLAANPQISDPNQIRAGDVLTIPPPDAPAGLPREGAVGDVTGDLADEADQPAFAPGYVDLTEVEARLDSQTLFIELLLVSGPPASDPEVERIDFTVNIDVDADDEPDFRLRGSNALTPDTGYAAVLEDLKTGAVSSVAAFPGTFSVATTVRFEVQRSALGTTRRYALAALAERRFFPGGAGDPEAEVAVDRAPDQQWPRANPRWLEVGIG